MSDGSIFKPFFTVYMNTIYIKDIIYCIYQKKIQLHYEDIICIMAKKISS